MSASTSIDRFRWFGLSSKEVLASLRTSSSGLSLDEARSRLLEHGPNELARTVATNTLVLFEVFYLFRARSLTETAFSGRIPENRWMWTGVAICMLLQFLVMYVLLVNIGFGTEGPHSQDWFFLLSS